MAEEARSQHILDRAAWIGSVLLLAVTVGAIAVIVFDLSKNFVHPTNWQDVLARSTSNGLSMRWSDLRISIGQWGPEESRPRFLAFLIQAYDHKLRLFLHHYVSLPPTFWPIAWLLQGVIAPIALFRLLRNLGGDRTASTAGVAVYMSSIGFLSGFSMAFIPGKSLVTVSLIIAMYLLSSISKDGKNKFSDAPPATIAAVLVTVFLGLFLDEVGVFAFVLLPIMFWHLFWDNDARPISGKPDWKGIALCAIPAVIFLAVVVFVIPPLYRHLYHQAFDYLGNVFAVGIGSLGAKSVFVGPHGTFGWAIIWQNFTNLFGLTLVPVQLSPFTNPALNNPNVIQTSNAPQLLGLAAFFVALGACAMARSKPAVALRGALIATVVFLVLMTLLSIRHNPTLSGYYYGATISLFIALLVGLALAVINSKGTAWRLAGVAAAALIVGVQINNFWFVNERWKLAHDENVSRRLLASQFKLSTGQATGSELSAIRSAWKDGKLEAYLRDHEVSVGGAILAHEFRTIDRLRPKAAK
jgi:hypothetical protein